MNHFNQNAECEYLETLNDMLETGPTAKYFELGDRTGTGRRSIFGDISFKLDLTNGRLPLFSSKYVWFKGVIVELLWFLKGRTDIAYLHEHGVHFWDSWVCDDGTFGPVYGKQMRDCNGVDQWAQVAHSLKATPLSRRHIISLWNPSDIPQSALPPCHGLVIQFCTDGQHLDCVMYQRSADAFLGVPFNIASYGAMTHILARLTGLEARTLYMKFGDYHVYMNHLDQCAQVFENSFHPESNPIMTIEPFETVEELTLEHFSLTGYKHHGRVTAPVAV